MRKAFDVAHNSILQNKGGLTTLNITLVLPIRNSPLYAVCSVNVGDSLAYVFSKRYGITELSVGSHDVNIERNMRDAGGAIGPVNGDDPYLTNLTFSTSTCEAGDIVFLTTDGVSDNFDPVVTKIAVPGRKDTQLQSVDKKAEMLPHERHLFAMKGMERVIYEYELETEIDVSAQDLCTALTEHIISLTRAKRLAIENPAYYHRKFKTKERRRIEEVIRDTLKSLPGKLDHATVVAYEAGVYHDEITPNSSCGELIKMAIDGYKSSNVSSSNSSTASPDAAEANKPFFPVSPSLTSSTQSSTEHSMTPSISASSNTSNSSPISTKTHVKSSPGTRQPLSSASSSEVPDLPVSNTPHERYTSKIPPWERSNSSMPPWERSNSTSSKPPWERSDSFTNTTAPPHIQREMSSDESTTGSDDAEFNLPFCDSSEPSSTSDSDDQEISTASKSASKGPSTLPPGRI